MKKVLLTGAALMLVGGMVATDATYAAEPGVKITGNARVRLWYKSDDYRNNFGNSSLYDSETSMDSRVRLDVTGTAAGGAYAKVRIRMMETVMGDGDTDGFSITHPNTSSEDGNVWVDKAYVGIPFNDAFTLEVGKYRSTYGPLPTTYNFFYDDVNLTGFRGLIKLNNIEINPFVEWMEEAQMDGTTVDKYADNDEMRFGVHIKAKLNADWIIGGMLGYQSDARDEIPNQFTNNTGFFGSLYTKGQSGQFGLVGEFAVVDGDINGMNSWIDDNTTTDLIGSDDTGFGGYVFPNYQIDKLNIGLNLGFTSGGFLPDVAYGFVMLGGVDNSKISDYRIGNGGDWLWAGLVTSYQINESLKLTGNFVYADVDAWSTPGDGPKGGVMGPTSGVNYNDEALNSAWELSAILQYTISKGADVYFSAGYLDPDFENSSMEEDGAFAALTRFELKF
ncbi:MAG: hypothetical protein AB7F61_15340 [Desulfobulbus sp.]